MPGVIGAAVHSSWAELVTVAAGPVLLDRRRVALVDPELPPSPYHHEALDLELAEAEVLIGTVRQSVTACTTAALREVQRRFDARAIVFERSPYDALPDELADVMASWAITCAADAMMYRETVAACAAELGMEVVRYPRKVDVIALAADALGWDAGELATAVKELGATVGPPWRKEHRYAAAAAMMVLGT